LVYGVMVTQQILVLLF